MKFYKEKRASSLVPKTVFFFHYLEGNSYLQRKGFTSVCLNRGGHVIGTCSDSFLGEDLDCLTKGKCALSTRIMKFTTSTIASIILYPT
jgi:hypothetical protein